MSWVLGEPLASTGDSAWARRLRCQASCVALGIQDRDWDSKCVDGIASPGNTLLLRQNPWCCISSTNICHLSPLLDSTHSNSTTHNVMIFTDYVFFPLSESIQVRIITSLHYIDRISAAKDRWHAKSGNTPLPLAWYKYERTPSDKKSGGRTPGARILSL